MYLGSGSDPFLRADPDPIRTPGSENLENSREMGCKFKFMNKTSVGGPPSAAGQAPRRV